jgi:hypothetical protein
MAKNLLQNVDMTYPTWMNIKHKLAVSDNTNPSVIFGSAFCPPTQNPVWSTNIPNYPKPLVGIDVPVLLKPKKWNRKTILILGESPLRNDKNIINGQNVIFGTPYAVHQDINSPKQCIVYKLIFDGLLSKGYSVYLTDIIKVWWKKKNLVPQPNDKVILEDELKIIPIDYIVSWGKRADAALKDMNINPTVSLPHPGQLNWNNWKLKIFRKAVYSGNLDYAKNIYYNPKGDDNPTTPDIVANEALIDIFNAIP